MNVVDLMWTAADVGFIGLVVGLAAIGNRLSLDSRADSLQRSDPGTASALRQAQAVSDYAYGLAAWMPEVIIVCTPSRRAALSGDDDYAREVTTPAPAVPEHADIVEVAAHVAPAHRVYVLSRLERRVPVRTGPATRRRRADSRRTRRRREWHAR